MYKKRKGTKTSKFGVSGRINHDSSEFYASRLYEDFPTEKEVKYTENKNPSNGLLSLNFHKSRKRNMPSKNAS